MTLHAASATVLAASFLFAVPASAQESGGEAQELAKKLSNPVASLISVPFQQNVDFGLGPVAPDGNEGVKTVLNIQPVIPIGISSNWNVIVRTILPVVYEDDIPRSGHSESGLGDVVQSFFFSPKAPGPGGVIWGVGPVGLYPSATNDDLGGQKWGLGPTFVVLKQSGPNTFGMLANHIWSVSGKSSRSYISATFLQPFYTYATKTGTTYSLNTESTYDWKHDEWTVPVNVAVSQLVTIGDQHAQIGAGARYYLQKPQGGPEWGLRIFLTLLFPKK